jgi:hypothetical protein
VLYHRFGDLFVALEEAGVTNFDRYRLDRVKFIDGEFVHVPPWRVNHQNLENSPIRAATEPTLNELDSLGVTAGVRIAEGEPGAIHLQAPLPSGSFAPSSAADELARALYKRDNLSKLRSAAAHKRHLFLWVHFDSGAPSAALQAADAGDFIPEPSPLPDGIDGAWVAGAWTNPQESNQLTSTLYFVDASGWHALGPVSAR